MPRTCTICRHPDSDGINVALIRREPFRRIAARTGTTEESLRRHKRNHLPVTLLKAAREVEVLRATSLLEQAEMFQAKTLSILAKAEAKGDLNTALSAIREARGNLVLLEHCLEKEREENSPEAREKRLVAENHMLYRQLTNRQDQRKLLREQIVDQNLRLKAQHMALDFIEDGGMQTPSPTRGRSPRTLFRDINAESAGLKTGAAKAQLESGSPPRALLESADGTEPPDAPGPFPESMTLAERINRMGAWADQARRRRNPYSVDGIPIPLGEDTGGRGTDSPDRAPDAKDPTVVDRGAVTVP